MSLRNLTDNEFESPNGGMMYLRIPGIVFVLFKTQQCHYCNEALPVFQQLSQKDRRLTWAVADVGKYRNIIQISNNTNLPIKGVPMMVLYIEGKPHANYKGPRNAPSIMKFLNEMLGQMQPQRQFAPPPSPRAPVSSQSPTYIAPPSKLPTPMTQNDTDLIPLPKNVVPYNVPYKKYLSGQ